MWVKIEAAPWGPQAQSDQNACSPPGGRIVPSGTHGSKSDAAASTPCSRTLSNRQLHIKYVRWPSEAVDSGVGRVSAARFPISHFVTSSGSLIWPHPSGERRPRRAILQFVFCNARVHSCVIFPCHSLFLNTLFPNSLATNSLAFLFRGAVTARKLVAMELVATGLDWQGNWCQGN
jgi:hypothetical protein